jgi:hypothetical protein
VKCPGCGGSGDAYSETVAAKRFFGHLRESDFSKDDFAAIKRAYTILARTRKPQQVDADVKDQVRAAVARIAGNRQRAAEREEALAGAKKQI